MEFTGKITYISKLEKVGANQMEKITFVLEEQNEEYPNSVALDLLGEKTEKMKYKVGDIVTAKFNVKAREYNGKYFNNLNAWMIKGEDTSGSNIDLGKESSEVNDIF